MSHLSKPVLPALRTLGWARDRHGNDERIDGYSEEDLREYGEACATAPVGTPSLSEEQKIMLQVGEAMVNMTTTLCGLPPGEWLNIPALWQACADERDRLRRAVLSAGTAATPDNAAELKVIASLGAALRNLTFHARTAGGVAGVDAGLMDACDKAEQAISLSGIGQAMLAAPADDHNSHQGGLIMEVELSFFERLQTVITDEKFLPRNRLQTVSAMLHSKAREAATPAPAATSDAPVKTAEQMRPDFEYWYTTHADEYEPLGSREATIAWYAWLASGGYTAPGDWKVTDISTWVTPVGEAPKPETVQLVGIKGSVHTVLGDIPMPPRMKAKEIIRGYFSGDPEDNETDAAMALFVCEELIKWMAEQAKLTATPLQPAGAADRVSGLVKVISKKTAAIEAECVKLREQLAKLATPAKDGS